MFVCDNCRRNHYIFIEFIIFTLGILVIDLESLLIHVGYGVTAKDKSLHGIRAWTQVRLQLLIHTGFGVTANSKPLHDIRAWTSLDPGLDCLELLFKMGVGGIKALL